MPRSPRSIFSSCPRLRPSSRSAPRPRSTKARPARIQQRLRQRPCRRTPPGCGSVSVWFARGPSTRRRRGATPGVATCDRAVPRCYNSYRSIAVSTPRGRGTVFAVKRAPRPGRCCSFTGPRQTACSCSGLTRHCGRGTVTRGRRAGRSRLPPSCANRS
jgi:hypothetical protein